MSAVETRCQAVDLTVGWYVIELESFEATGIAAKAARRALVNVLQKSKEI